MTVVLLCPCLGLEGVGGVAKVCGPQPGLIGWKDIVPEREVQIRVGGGKIGPQIGVGFLISEVRRIYGCVILVVVAAGAADVGQRQALDNSAGENATGVL